MAVSRRSFMTVSAAAAVVASTGRVPRLWADANFRAGILQGERILVVVQLSGGNDGLNTVIPFGDDAYHKNRFATRIANDVIHKIDNYVGLHPSMKDLAGLHRERRCSIVQGVGYPNPNRSHFESMDIWHSAQMAPPHRTGWIGRWVDQQASEKTDTTTAAGSSALTALHIGDEPLPLAVTGLNAMVPSLKAIDSLRIAPDELVRAALKNGPANAALGADATKGELLDFLRGTRATALAAAEKLQSVGGDDSRSRGYDQSQLSLKLAAVAQLIGIDFGPRVYYVELAGFDTHSQQAEAHSALLGEVSRALGAFHRDLKNKSLDDRVLSVCFSEFGRRVKENGSRGTDHGTAAPLFIAGPEGLPSLVGKYPSLTDLDEGDLKFSVDFRSVYATLLEKWLGIPSLPILGKQFDPLDLFT